MNFSYLCIVNESGRKYSQGSQNLFPGLTEFAACPARKNGHSSATREQNPMFNKNVYNNGIENYSLREIALTYPRRHRASYRRRQHRGWRDGQSYRQGHRGVGWCPRSSS